jgi:hypothetical protein
MSCPFVHNLVTLEPHGSRETHYFNLSSCQSEPSIFPEVE